MIQYDDFDNNIFTFINNGSYRDIEDEIIKNSSVVNARDAINNTPLMSACQSANVDIVKLLLKYKADVNLKNKLGSTALHFACINTNIEMIQLLLTAGADCNAITYASKTAVDYAIFWNNMDVVDFLKKYREKMRNISAMNMVILSNKTKQNPFINLFFLLPWQIEKFLHYDMDNDEILNIMHYRIRSFAM